MTDNDPVLAVVQRVLPAEPADVYAEWIDPDALREWMCPRPAYATAIELDPQVGGDLRFDIDDEGARMVVTGRFLVLDPPNRIQFTWSCSTWPAAATESVVTVTLEPHQDDATLMTICHAALPADLVDNHERGWALIAQQFELRLRKR